MNIYIWSQSLRTLTIESMCTSSEKFEFHFAYNLSKQENKKCIIFSTALKENECQEVGNLRLIGVSKEKRESIRVFRKYISLDENVKTALIFYGYDLFYLLLFLYLKWTLKIKLVSFIFDSHKGAIAHYFECKKKISELYFGVAILLLRFTDGHILFQKDAAMELKLLKPVLISKPGVTEIEASKFVYNQQSSDFVIGYFGTLIDYHGINELIEFMKKYKAPNLRLKIYGRGPLQNKVAEYSKIDKRVLFGGVVSGEGLEQEIRETDLLLNLRNPNDYVNKFAFPSKLIEYIMVGIPVLTSDLNFPSELAENLFVLKEFTVESIWDSILTAMNETNDVKVKMIEKSQRYLLENNGWTQIGNDTIKFLEKL